jgi:hypothetical protein
MKVRTTVILFGVFLILLVFVYLFEGPLSEKGRRQQKGVVELFPGFQKESAVKISVKSPTKKLILERQASGWKIADTDNFFADPQLVDTALETIAQFTREVVASRNPEKKEIFEVVPGKGLEVIVFAADQEPLAHFILGKAAPDFFSSYVRKEGSDEVFQVSANRTTFEKDIKNWRDKTILAFPAELATQLTLTRPDESVTLEKDESGSWKIVKPEQVKAQQEVVEKIISTLSSLKALDFAEGYDETKYQLDDPLLTITLILKDQVEKRLLIGKLDEEKAQYYAKNQADKTIFLIGKYQFETSNKSFADLKADEESQETEQEGVTSGDKNPDTKQQTKNTKTPSQELQDKP